MNSEARDLGAEVVDADDVTPEFLTDRAAPTLIDPAVVKALSWLGVVVVAG